MTRSAIQFDSAARLAFLQDVAADAHGRSLRLSEIARDLARSLTDAKADLARFAEAAFDHDLRNHSFDPSMRSPTARIDAAATLPGRPDYRAAGLAERERRVADLEAALVRARRDADDAASEWTAKAQLVGRCEAFARERGLPLPVSLQADGVRAWMGA